MTQWEPLALNLSRNQRRSVLDFGIGALELLQLVLDSRAGWGRWKRLFVGLRGGELEFHSLELIVDFGAGLQLAESALGIEGRSGAGGELAGDLGLAFEHFDFSFIFSKASMDVDPVTDDNMSL
eukprot:CAMPEP_0197429396 /NCGR_PEP_ID=MMETSP1170-20131217/43771_1 /TAXON_ID=54406 /ORGANISM="Sarcinochrysis sp, Strain CCMP770" /LENGTH=123 /DNA_ID=CAMNT_0042957231 /DNA_START=211 /DNA_END=580 /DNA_ORIENTATION=-